jgi:hypothetical protein
MKSCGGRWQSTTVILTLLILSAATIWPVYAVEEKPTGEFAFAAFSQYIWRGYELSRDSVVFQPSMTIVYKGFSANMWGNLDTDPYSAGTGKSYLLSTDEKTCPEFNSDALPTSRKFSNLHDGALTASLPIKATSYIPLTPTVSYIFPLSRDAKNEMKGFGLRDVSPVKRDSSFIVAGLTAGFAF